MDACVKLTISCLLYGDCGARSELPGLYAGLWMCQESVGDAGASALGYYGGVFGPGGRSIAANGFTGALHVWERSDVDTTGGDLLCGKMCPSLHSGCS